MSIEAISSSNRIQDFPKVKKKEQENPKTESNVSAYNNDSLKVSNQNKQDCKDCKAIPISLSLDNNEDSNMKLVNQYTGKEGIFPSDWRSRKVNAKASPASEVNTNKAKEELHSAFSKYPSDFLQSDLNKIHLVEKLYCFGVSYAGTNSRDAVYLDVGFNDIEKTFHHEVSSILLRNNSDKFDRYDWNKLSRGASTSSANAINHGLNSTKYNPELFSKGFLTDYSMSNAENDFNMYAENIFAGGKEFWDIVDSNPIVKEKTDIVINFYNKINPMFNEPYFRALAR